FDYAEVRPWLRHAATHTFAAIGGDSGLLISADQHLEAATHDIACRFDVRAQERVRFSVEYYEPALLDQTAPAAPDHEEIDRRLQETLDWWERWARQAQLHGPDAPAALRSALTLKALSQAPTGAIAAAATTSLPELPGG